jgi:gamma-butyrobetaine dioxygenase
VTLIAVHVPSELDMAEAHVANGRLVVRMDESVRTFHPLWLLDRSTDPLDVDSTNRQRLFEPTDVPADFAVSAVSANDLGVLDVTFNDGRCRRVTLDQLRSWTGRDPETPPPPIAWTGLDGAPRIHWDDVCNSEWALRETLGAFHELGCFVIHNAPTTPGSLLDIAGRFGRVSATNFGTLFDVVSRAEPDDLAYTPVGLSAHLDQPYRRPAPGLQFLHTLVNDAPGGGSTVVDGLAAVEALRRHDPSGHEILCRLPIEFRYDIGSDVVVHTAPIIDRNTDGSLRQLRFSTRLDFAPCVDPDVLDRFYAARRWLAEWLNDPAHQVEFKMSAGDVLVVDNHRVLHGRRPFDPAGGRRHLQGCYVDHDGPATMWRLLTRRLNQIGTP